mgnify:CR=1 FL=1
MQYHVGRNRPDPRRPIPDGRVGDPLAKPPKGPNDLRGKPEPEEATEGEETAESPAEE